MQFLEESHVYFSNGGYDLQLLCVVVFKTLFYSQHVSIFGQFQCICCNCARFYCLFSIVVFSSGSASCF